MTTDFRGHINLATWCNQNNSHLIEEWDYEGNAPLTPFDVSYACNDSVSWKCSKGHIFPAVIANRTRGSGCPYCSGRKVLSGFNDLATKYPEIATEWDYEKNFPLTPDRISSASNSTYMWICPRGHSYDCSADKRTLRGSGCPYCSGKRVLVGFNDLKSQYPEYAKEWDYEKNMGLIDKSGRDISTPDKISTHSNHNVYWLCPFGHSFKMKPNDRTSRHRGCLECSKELRTSFPEQALYYYVKQYYPDAINGNEDIIGMELDIYIPPLKIAVEYDGVKWHNRIEQEKKKNRLCSEKGIKLIRVREESLSLYEDCYCIRLEKPKVDNDLSAAIKKVLCFIDDSIDYEIDIDKDAMTIYSSYISLRKTNSLANIYPEVAKEWHPTMNKLLTPEMVTPYTHKKVFWLGKCGHSFPASISNRVIHRSSCPFCSGRSVLKGFNDLESQFPEIIKNWDYEKNTIMPDEITPHSNQYVWWKCHVCGYEWRNKVNEITNAFISRRSLVCRQCSGYAHPMILCVETGKVYKTGNEATKATGITTGSINQCCKGRLKSAGGYHWQYIE
ncbi:MAG: hypothetical protein K5665_00755 [Saccharofermentans sp.]|nr:hypothetical protein [Saccharofermentans sp.]